MADEILNDGSCSQKSFTHEDLHFVLSLNDYDALLENLTKAEAIAYIALHCTDFLDQPSKVIHTYLWVLNDYMEQVKEGILSLQLKEL